MKRNVCLLGVALLSWFPLALSAQTTPQAPASKVTTVEKIADGIWMAQTSLGSNAGWFLTGDEVVAVDAGSDADTGRALLDKIRETTGKPVRFLVITHAHGDHAGGAAPFVAAGAEVLCQENAAAAVAPLVETQSRTRLGMLAFSERLGLFGGPRRAAIYFLGPAHTNNDLIVYLPEDKVLFSGDVALGGRAPYMQSPDVDPKNWENVLTRLAQLNLEKIVPGHGTLGTRQALADTYAYVKRVNDLAQTMAAENVSVDLVESRLRRPDSGVAAASITPDLIANLQAVMRAEKAKTGAKPTPSPKAPAKKPAMKK